MSYRVIGGSAKGRRLAMVQGDSTRPITDRVKESLFNILGRSVVDTRWLDLFAGTGAVGIEALSRGAASATFTELHPLAIKTINENLKTTDFTAKSTVLRTDAFDYLRRPVAQPFSVVYVAPPQYEGLWKKTLTVLDAHTGTLEPDALVILQIDPKEQEPIHLQHLIPYDERQYGNTLLWFFEFDADFSSDGS